MRSKLRGISTLAELCHRFPELDYLIQEWHKTKNAHIPPYDITLTPDMVTPDDSRIVWWKNADGTEWQASVKERVEEIIK